MKIDSYEPPMLEIVEVVAEFGTLYSTGLDVPPGEDYGDEEWV